MALGVAMACGLAALLFGASPALAARAELAPISEADGSPFTDAYGVAVDDSDDLWVTDFEGGEIDKFNSTDDFLISESPGVPWLIAPAPLGVAFSNASQHLFVTEFYGNNVWGLEPSAAYAGVDLTGPWSGSVFSFEYVKIAADNSGGATGGDLYVAGESGSVYRVDGSGSEAPFESSGEPYVIGDQLTGFGPGKSFSGPVTGLAVDAAGDLYVADGEAVYEFESSGKFLRSFTEAEGTSLGGVSAVAIDPTNGHVLIAAGGLIDEFSSTSTYLDDIEGVGGGATDMAVDSTGRLYVAEGSVVGVYGAYTPPTHEPEIAYGAPSGVAVTAATLNATVKPKGGGEVSECLFEYGESESYGQSVPCDPATFSSTSAVTGELSGLSPGRLYYYRVYVVDPITGPGGASGPADAFRTLALNPVVAGPPASGCPNPGHGGLSVRLPDCRAYELLTPVDLGDSEDIFGETSEIPTRGIGDTSETGFPEESPGEEGDRFFLTAASSFGPDADAGQNAYVFSRSPGGWQETSLAPHAGGVQSITGSPLLSGDFSRVAIEDKIGSTGNEAAFREAGLVGPVGEAEPYATLYESSGYASNGSELAGASSDLGRVFFQSTEHRYAVPAEEQLAGSHALYEHSGGHDSLVNVKSDGELTSACGAVSPVGQPGVSTGAHAVSSDGSRVFFLSPDPQDASCYGEHEPELVSDFTGAPPQLYVRFGGRTVEVSEAKGIVDPDGPQPVAFAGASEDGSRVFFETRGELTPDDAGNHDPELYEYDIETEALTRISSGDSHNAVGNVGWVVPSEDGSTVYFTATGGLAPGAPSLPNNPSERATQQYNLYRYDTESAATTFIATVSGNDWFQAETGGTLALNIRQPINERSDWESTPDGGFLLFDAVEDLTGYDSHDPTEHCAGEIPGNGGFTPEHACAEVYRYDAADGSLVCVSCDPGGGAPSANALFDANTRYHEVRAISDSGAYVFFNSSEELVPTATNGLENVYEWHEGAISLISSGQDSSDSYFLGTDASGADVFFGSHARLVPQDTDTSGNLYDARIDGGFPVSQSSPPCESDDESGACQSPPAPSGEATPSSLTLSGPGNLTPPVAAPTTVVKPTPKAKGCKKGFGKKKVKKKIECVRKPKKAKKTTKKKGK